MRIELPMQRMIKQGSGLPLLDILVLGVLVIMSVTSSAFAEEPESKPLFREFMGINGHTVQFRPKLYATTCQLVRDYHSFNWDVGDETTSEEQNPTHTYKSTGDFDVTLTVKGPGGSDVETKLNYITVSSGAAPVAEFSADVTTGSNPLEVNFTDW